MAVPCGISSDLNDEIASVERGTVSNAIPSALKIKLTEIVVNGTSRVTLDIDQLK